MAHINLTTILFALGGGFAPVLFWLWFWLREDKNPEPGNILMFTFINGMAAILLALAAEYAVSIYASGTIMILLWAFIEETLKYFAAKEAALKRSSFDEPIDALVYLITAALGFSALENFFFLLQSSVTQGLLSGFITGNLRFIGATLLHTATSAIVGASMAFSFFHKHDMRRNVIGGIFLAGILHFIFNYFIIKTNGGNVLKIFIPLWLGIIIMIFIFEKVKRLKSNQQI